MNKDKYEQLKLKIAKAIKADFGLVDMYNAAPEVKWYIDNSKELVEYLQKQEGVEPGCEVAIMTYEVIKIPV